MRRFWIGGVSLVAGIGIAHGQQVTYFSGADPGIGPGDPSPDSDLAASSFDAAAALLGDGVLHVLDFESANLGDFLNLSPAEVGVTGLAILGAGSSNGSDTAIVDVSPLPVEGFNTTAGGTNFLKIEENHPGAGVEPPVGVTFDFVNPVAAFGAYITGADPAVSGAITAVFDDGLVRTIPLDFTPGGGTAFWGFTLTNPSKPVTRVTVLASPELGINTDVVGIDDVRWVSAVPEPGPSFLVAIAVGVLMLLRRR